MNDFGVFAGRQKIHLTPPSSNRPIVLFGGMNGTGKTTLMDALQLGLFGRAAICASQNGGRYENYLDRKIRSESPSNESSVSVDFQFTKNHEETHYRVTRTWRRKKSGIRENLKVSFNHRDDEHIKEYWNQYVNDIIPANLAHLFFFDGEQISEHSTANGISKLVQTGVQNLFGLDVVDRIQKDLLILEKRQLSHSIPNVDNDTIRQKEHELQCLREEIDRIEEERSLQEYKLKDARDERSCVTREYEKLGGEIRDKREFVQNEIRKLELSLDNCRNRMVELANSELPLTLVLNLLQDVVQHAIKEQNILQARSVVENLSERDSEMLALTESLPNSSQFYEVLEQFCLADIQRREKLASESTYFNLNDSLFYRLNSTIQNELPNLAKNADYVLEWQQELEAKLNVLQLENANIPAEDSIEEIVAKRNHLMEKISQIETAISEIDSNLASLRRKVQRLESDIDSLWENHAKSEILQTDESRYMRHSIMARQMLRAFGSAILDRQITRVEDLTLECFQNLLRKDKMITELRINPEDFSVVLRNYEQIPITPEQLSAGERQLLVVALLSGLGKTSGRALPIAIDSPLGRLDSTHRAHLVERYFPCASHQTLLFSTDEEIAGDYFDKLKPWIGRSYLLLYNEKTNSSTISNEFE